MSRLFYHVAQDSAGNLLFGVTGTMRIANTATLATIYGDEGMTVILPNPMTNHPSFGSFKCYLDAGDYDFYMAKGGYTFETLTGVQGHGTMAQQDADAVGITGGSLVGIVALGIATPNPTYPLDVQGTTLLNGATGIQSVPDATYSLKVGADSYFMGNMGIGSAPNANFDLVVTGQTLLVGNVAIGDGTMPVNYNLRVSGTAAKPGGGSWTDTASMAKYKPDRVPLTNVLPRLLQLRGYRYTNTHPTHAHLGEEMGLLAEDVQAVFPHWIVASEGGDITYGEQGTMAVVIEALRELAQQVEALTARLDAAGGIFPRL